MSFKNIQKHGKTPTQRFWKSADGIEERKWINNNKIVSYDSSGGNDVPYKIHTHGSNDRDYYQRDVPPFNDHGIFYKDSKGRVYYVFHPYGEFDIESIHDILDWCDLKGLKAEVITGEENAWYADNTFIISSAVDCTVENMALEKIVYREFGHFKNMEFRILDGTMFASPIERTRL